MKKIETSLDIKSWFDSLKDNIDLWITDPPYPFDNKNGSSRFKYSDGDDMMYSRMEWSDLESFFGDAIARSNDGARLYTFCNRDGIRKTWDILESSGWIVRNMLVWDKKIMGMGYHWRNQAEYIIYASKGKPKNYIKGVGNIFRYKKPRGIGISAKPYEIWRDILLQALNDGDVCADPFSGSNPMTKAFESEEELSNMASNVYINIF
tara:strand:- start:858 stop:1478 length:621 start_codon:yes stop_codon:yes gene_type:complete